MMVVDNEFILKRVDQLLKVKGISSRTELALQTNLSSSIFSEWSKGRKFPSLSSIIQICSVLEVSLSEFFASDGDEIKNARENKILEYWKQLNTTQQDVLLYTAQAFLLNKN